MIQNFDRYFEKNDGIETDYIKILYYDLAKDYKATYKSYQYTRLCTIVEGSKHVKINDGNEFTYSTSDFILLPPNSSVKMEMKEDTKAIVYEINDKLLDDMIKRIEHQFEYEVTTADKPVVRNQLMAQIKSQIERINAYSMSQDPNKEFLIDLVSQEMVYTLIKNYKLPLRARKKEEPVAYAVQCLKDHLSGSDMTVNEIAYELNMSPSNLIPLFKKATGLTPKAYHNLLKINKAKELLLHKNVSEVSYDLGFESISYFIKLFKHHLGLTPKQYTMKYKQDHLI
ncbi:MAG: AraC family transcriptional regulator [Vallitaleaceae bacterium]|nr:AraC family transcriptional regulator [Vallitaleaceae bacterium]